MDCDTGLKSLVAHASAYEFDDFEDLFQEMLSASSGEGLQEAHRMRAQIKLFAADETLLGDLERGEGEEPPALPCLGRQWVFDSPNRFVVFNRAQGGLDRFVRALPAAEEGLARWYGAAGRSMARQMQAEILYYRGDAQAALAIAHEYRQSPLRHSGDDIALFYLLFRCYLALGEQEGAKESMLQMVKLARGYPECEEPYQTVREWTNMTTGWSGDTPRFHHVPGAGEIPVLEDRLEAVRKGIPELSASEKPFAAYARRAYRGSLTMRRHYMDVFYTILWYQAGDFRQMEASFLRACRVSLSTGIVMPFVEYGKQILPLFRHIRDSEIACPPEWMEKIYRLAERYEESLEVYRT